MINNKIHFSRIKLFDTNKTEYKNRYILGIEDRFITKEMNFGTNFALSLENGAPDREVKNYDPAYIPEYKISVPFVYNGVEYEIYGTMDACSPDYTHFYEYKTGKTEWTQDIVDNHKQLDFYAYLISRKTNGLISCVDCTLAWFPTQNTEDGGIEFTGEEYAFNRTFDSHEYDFEKYLRAKIDEMIAYEEEYLKNSENLELEKLTIEFAEAKQQVEKLEEFMDSVKEKVAENTSIGYSVDGIGSFYYMTKKVVKYSDTVNELEKQAKELAAQIKAAKEAEEKN